jgi:hypothetical protein
MDELEDKIYENDELSIEPEEYEPIESMGTYEELHIIDKAEADFLHWSQRAYWTLDQGIALLLSKDPYEVYWKRIRGYVNFPYSTQVSYDYGKLRMIVVQARNIKEIPHKMSPTAFLEWAERKCLAIPLQLKQQVEKINANMKMGAADPHQAELDLMKKKLEESAALLKAKDTEIRVLQKEHNILQKHIKELENSQWKGFNKEDPAYSRELDIAVMMYLHISKNWKEGGKSIKQQMLEWLRVQYPEDVKGKDALSEGTRERIARICNWQKEGGAPSTPKRC